MTGWHVTNKINRDGIKAEGLRKDVMGWDTGYVWFFTERAQAERSAATGSWGLSRGNNDIWEIDLDGYEVLPDPHPGWGEDRSNRCVAHSIPSDRIRLLVAHEQVA